MFGGVRPQGGYTSTGANQSLSAFGYRTMHCDDGEGHWQKTSVSHAKTENESCWPCVDYREDGHRMVSKKKKNRTDGILLSCMQDALSPEIVA